MLSWALIAQPDGWLSNVLIEVGATLLLFAPLLIIGKRVENRLSQVQQTADQIEARQDKVTADVASLTEQVAETKAEIRRTQDELSIAVIARLNEARAGDERMFEATGTEPSRQNVIDALRRAAELGLITKLGCRVAIYDTEYYLLFQPFDESDGYDPSVDLWLRIENESGENLGAVNWSSEMSALDLLVRVGEKLQEIGGYPGDIAFDSAKVFTDLMELLSLAYRQATGKEGIRNPIGRIYQYCAPQWAITTNAVVKVGGFFDNYVIHLDRLDELDWYDHVKGKNDVDSHSLWLALRDARSLYESGRLVPSFRYYEVQP